MGIHSLFIKGETATMIPMTVPKFYIESADPSEIKQVAAALGGLDGQLITVAAILNAARSGAVEAMHSVEGLRAYMKHVIEATEPFLPGGQVLVEELYDPHATPDMLVESVRRTLLWGRQSSLVLPVCLTAIEAGNMLSRMGSSFAFSPVTTIDQAAAILSATREAAAEQVILMIPFNHITGMGLSPETLIQGIAALEQQSSPQGRLILRVETLDAFMTVCSYAVDAIAAPPEVFTAWINAGRPVEPTAVLESDTAVPETTEVVPVINLDAEQQSFTISTPYTDRALAENLDTWKQLIS